jgi:hypothetical protein
VIVSAWLWRRKLRRRLLTVRELVSFRRWYRRYLGSAGWRARRNVAIRRANGRCERCFAAGVALQVHHRNYRNIGRERGRDLEAVCAGCHARIHAGNPRVQRVTG